MALTAKLDTLPLEQALRRLDRRTGRRVLARALNDGLQGMAVETKRTIRAEVNVKAGRVNRALRKQRAGGAKSYVELGVSGAPIPLTEYGARQGKRGTSFKIKRSGKRHRWSKAFVATMPSGHKGVFRRDQQRAKTRKAPRYHALPIVEQVGPGLAQQITDRRTKRKLLEIGQRRFEREMHRQIGLATKR